jgi:hypothetical protein
MPQTGLKLVEYTAIHYKFGDELNQNHARWFRGAIGKLMDRPEFHHHAGSGLAYQHPLIRYQVHGTEATIAGLAEGAFLLRSLPGRKSFWLGTSKYRVLDQTVEVGRQELRSTARGILSRTLRGGFGLLAPSF